MAAIAYFPGTVAAVITAYEHIIENEGRISDIVTGFLDPDGAENPVGEALEESNAAIEAENEANRDEDSDDDDDSSSDDETESGPDPEETRLRFELLREKLVIAEGSRVSQWPRP